MVQITKQKTLIIVCGNSTCNFKNILTNAMLEWSSTNSTVMQISHSLKNMCNLFIESWDIDQSFYEDKFKDENLEFFNAARTIIKKYNKEILAKELSYKVLHDRNSSGENYETVIVDDINCVEELNYLEQDLSPLGWRIITIWFENVKDKTSDVNNLKEIYEEYEFDIELYFNEPDSSNIRNQGKLLARNFNL